MKRAIWTAAALALALVGPAAQAQAVIIYPSYGYSYGPLWSGPLVNNVGSFYRLNQQQWAGSPLAFGYGGGYGGGITAGVNAPPLGRTRSRRVTFRNEEGTTRAEAPAQTRQGDREASRLESLMAERPLISGTVVRVGATGVSVRLEQGEKARNVRFELDEVFFFRGGEIATAKGAPNVLQAGDRVLVPQPEK